MVGCDPFGTFFAAIIISKEGEGAGREKEREIVENYKFCMKASMVVEDQ